MIITIDGTAGTGKSTVAKGVAKALGFAFFDTGAMYRSFAWYLLQEEIDPQDHAAIIATIPNFQFDIRKEHGERRYFVQESDITDQIRKDNISMVASQIAVYPEVRSALVKIQRRYGRSVDAVFEGRDMGTVVFPKADLKIFLTAKAEVRAQRRYQELKQKFPDRTWHMDEILKEMKERDETDANRTHSPLKKATDAIEIDTSNLTAQEVIDKIVKAAPKRQFPKMKLVYKTVYWMARTYFKCFYGLKVYGLEHFCSSSAIIAANHSSFFDPPVLSISCPEEVHFLAKESLIKVPILGPLIKKLNSHPVHRGSSDPAVLRMMIELLQKGNKLILFPEGIRSKTGALMPLQRGIAFLAQKAECPIIPAYIHGAFDAWPPTRKLPKPFGKLTVVFGSPLEFVGDDSKAGQEDLVRRLEAAMRGLREWLLAGANGTPP